MTQFSLVSHYRMFSLLLITQRDISVLTKEPNCSHLCGSGSHYYASCFVHCVCVLARYVFTRGKNYVQSEASFLRTIQ